MHYKSALIFCTIVSIGFLLIRCVDNSGEAKEKSPDPFQKFAGSEACARCHKDIYEKHLHTEHHLTSSLPNDTNILGSFDEGRNIFSFDMLNKVRMERTDSGFFQVQYRNGYEIKRGRFDIVIGSGRKGQSYLYWLNDRLSQLPITYFNPAGQWSNSPGYPPADIVFYRPITSRCLECHSTYFKKTAETPERIESYDRSKIIFGVECEKCHGPAAAHVEFHTKNPGVKEARNVINPGKLSRERLLDLCALCHGGRLQKSRPSFQFQAGDTLSNYFSIKATVPNANDIDVHGNQLGLLSFSKCFIVSNMTCISCHNIHENENGKTQLFSQRCMNCHGQEHIKSCKMTATIGPSITRNCIDCHMPKQPSHAVSVYLEGSFTPTPALMRTHYIKVYAEETKKVLAALKRK